MPPNKQQYKMHECCKTVNELKAMTSVMSPTLFHFLHAYRMFTPTAFSARLPRVRHSNITKVPLPLEAKYTLRLDGETEVHKQQEMFP